MLHRLQFPGGYAVKLRKCVLLCLLLALCLTPVLSLAELQIRLASESVAVGSILDFTLEGDSAPLYRYTLVRDGKKLFTTEAAGVDFGSYLPRQTGDYVLTVAAVHEDGEETAQAAFTVTDVLACRFLRPPEAVRTGEAVKVETAASGGTGQYRYVYAVYSGERLLLQEEGDAAWWWVPGQAGDYAIEVTTVDSQGAFARCRSSFTALPGPGISLEPAGGALLAHGGQRSWRVYSSGTWTAASLSDFIRVEDASGPSGGTLTVTVDTPTDRKRTGLIAVSCGENRIEFEITQSAAQGVDEEISLFALPTVLADGQAHALWLDAQGSRDFLISAPGACVISVEGAFLHAEMNGDILTVSAEPSEADAARSGTVTVSASGSAAYVHVYQQPGAVITSEWVRELPVPEDPETGFVLYSQFSGLWKTERYGSSTLEHSGCAIFALSHALQHLGFEGEAIQPRALAKKYAFCLREDGTINSSLIGNAGDDFGFKTRYELYKDLPTIRRKMDEGAVFSFAVVNGHIAMVIEKSPDGVMFRVVDSAPSATWERIKNAQLFRREADGSFRPISSLSELEGARFYIENGVYGGLTYWLTDEYIARRGVRLIQPLPAE